MTYDIGSLVIDITWHWRLQNMLVTDWTQNDSIWVCKEHNNRFWSIELIKKGFKSFRIKNWGDMLVSYVNKSGTYCPGLEPAHMGHTNVNGKLNSKQ